MRTRLDGDAGAWQRAEEPEWQRDEVSHPLMRRRRAALPLSSPEGEKEHRTSFLSWLDQLGQLHVENAARAAVAHHGAKVVPGVACRLWGWDVMATQLIMQVLQNRLSRPLTRQEKDVARWALDGEAGYLDDLPAEQSRPRSPAPSHEPPREASRLVQCHPGAAALAPCGDRPLHRSAPVVRPAARWRCRSRRGGVDDGDVRGGPDPRKGPTGPGDRAQGRADGAGTAAVQPAPPQSGPELARPRPRRVGRPGPPQLRAPGRVLEREETSLRREGAALTPEQFERVCDQLRSGCGWS